MQFRLRNRERLKRRSVTTLQWKYYNFQIPELFREFITLTLALLPLPLVKHCNNSTENRISQHQSVCSDNPFWNDFAKKLIGKVSERQVKNGTAKASCCTFRSQLFTTKCLMMYVLQLVVVYNVLVVTVKKQTSDWLFVNSELNRCLIHNYFPL